MPYHAAQLSGEFPIFFFSFFNNVPCKNTVIGASEMEALRRLNTFMGPSSVGPATETTREEAASSGRNWCASH